MEDTHIAKFDDSTRFAVSNSLIYKPLNLSLNESRLFFMLVSQIDEQDEEFKTYKIYIKDLIDILKPKSSKNLYAQVKREMLSLENKKFDYDDGKKTAPIRLLVEPVYHEREGYITARIHHLLKPDLLKLKREFTVGLLCEMLRFKSYNTQRIYLMVRQYQNARVKVNRINVEDLKKLLNLEDKYPRFNDFRKRVLDPAQKEICKAGLEFEIRENKSGRTVTSVDFVIISNNMDKHFLGVPTVAPPAAAQEPVAVPVTLPGHLDEKSQRLIERLEELELDKWQIGRIMALPDAQNNKDIWKIVNAVRMEKRDGNIKGSVGGHTARLFDKKFGLGFFA